MTSKNSVAAQNRFVYYPDHLVRMPGPGVSLLSNIINILTEPVFTGLVWGAVKEFYRVAPSRPDGLEDESIGSFISRRLGSGPANNLASAVMHGIYAGDIYSLSARTILPGPWETERKLGSILQGSYLQRQLDHPKPTDQDSISGSKSNDEFAYSRTIGRRPVAAADVELIRDFNSRPAILDTLEPVKESSVFTFKGGLGELATRLESTLLKNPKVVVQMHSRVKQLKLQSGETGSEVCHSSELTFHTIVWRRS